MYLISELHLAQQNEKLREMLPTEGTQTHGSQLIFAFGQKLFKKKVGSVICTLQIVTAHFFLIYKFIYYIYLFLAV